MRYSGIKFNTYSGTPQINSALKGKEILQYGNGMDETWGHYPKTNKSVTKTQMLHIST